MFPFYFYSLFGMLTLDLISPPWFYPFSDFLWDIQSIDYRCFLTFGLGILEFYAWVERILNIELATSAGGATSSKGAL